jgi:hypothetical protein
MGILLNGPEIRRLEHDGHYYTRFTGCNLPWHTRRNLSSSPWICPGRLHSLDRRDVILFCLQ